MNYAGMSYRQIERSLDRNQTIISRVVRKYQHTNDIKDSNRPGQPRKTSPREHLFDVAFFSSSTILRHNCIPNRAKSTRVIRIRLKTAGYRTRWLIKRPLMTPEHKPACLAWCQIRHRSNLASR